MEFDPDAAPVALLMWRCAYSREVTLSVNCCHADAKCEQVFVTFRYLKGD